MHEDSKGLSNLNRSVRSGVLTYSAECVCLCVCVSVSLYIALLPMREFNGFHKGNEISFR